MASPLLFLDIDGVLNSYQSDFAQGETPLDPENIACFNRIIAATGAEIVVTSSPGGISPPSTTCAATSVSS